MASCGHSTASKNRDIVEVFGYDNPPYWYYSSLKKKYNFVEGDMGFRSFMDMIDGYFDFIGGVVCALTGRPEPWPTGEDPGGNYYRYFHLDHCHKIEKKIKEEGGMMLLSLRGFIEPAQNTLLGNLENSPLPLQEELKARGKIAKYLADPPFQQFLRKHNRKEYKEMVEGTGRYDPRWV